MAPATCLVCRRAIRAAPVASGARVRPTPGPAARRAALRTGAALATGLLLGGRQARAEDSPPGYTDATRALIDASEALVQGEITDYSGWQQVRKEWDASYKKKYGKHSTSHLLAIRVSGMVGGQVAKNVAQDSPFTPESTLYNPDFARELITRARTALDNDE